MSFRDWLHNAAIGGCLIVGVLVWTPALAQQENRVGGDATGQNTENIQDKTSADTQSATTHFAPGNRVDDHTYAAICDSPKDGDHADLCQQWRMAEVAKVQLWLSVFGLVLLSGTLVFTAIAAVAARDAVKEAAQGTEAARQAVTFTRQAHVTEQRPWLAVRAVKMSQGVLSDDVISAFLWIRLINIGKSPAINVATHSLSYYRTTGAKEVIADFDPKLAEWGRHYPGKTLVPNDWIEMGFNVLLVKKGILATEAPVYKDKLILKIAVGATYKPILSDEIFRSARSYMVFINQVTEGSVADNLMDFHEMDGGSSFS